MYQFMLNIPNGLLSQPNTNGHIADMKPQRAVSQEKSAAYFPSITTRASHQSSSAPRHLSLNTTESPLHTRRKGKKKHIQGKPETFVTPDKLKDRKVIQFTKSTFLN